MKLTKRNKIILIVILILLFVVFYKPLDSKVENFLSEEKMIFVERAIDGDTIVDSERQSIRLLGINAPERGEKYFEESKEFLEDLVLNKSVKLEFVGAKEDKYYRTLAYVFLGSENINVKLVKNGFANYYFYSGRDKYSEELENAWEICLEKEINLCERSENSCSQCVVIEENFIANECGFVCDVDGWEIKGEGRDKFVFNGSLNPNEGVSFDLDLANSGGSLFLRDDEGKLVSWRN